MLQHRPFVLAVGLAALVPVYVGVSAPGGGGAAAADSLPMAAPSPLAAQPPTWALLNGRWFDGERFVPRTLYAVHGLLTEHAPPTVDSTLDLNGLHLVPPFGEAHNHNVEDNRLTMISGAYPEDGIFYALNPDAIPRFVERARPLVGRPETMDAVFAVGGWTGPDGHPMGLYDRNLGLGIFREEDGEGAFFWTAATAADVRAKWDDFLARRPGLVKVYLLYSERPPEELPRGWRGLDRDVLVAVVERAHASGLRVTAHVETAADFRTAVAAGVEQIAHLPGFRPGPPAPRREVPTRETHALTTRDARDAAERGVVVVTTASLVDRLEIPDEVRERWLDVVLHNLATLRDAGVTLAVGSDDYRATSRPEAEWLASLDLFTNAQVLRMWSETTSNAIFPERRIGCFAEGCEASFLGLGADPLEDFEATRHIAVRFKQGRRLEVSDP